MLTANADVYYAALIARDARYDGRFFVAVKTTGVYCRPKCPAPNPKAVNCLFFRSAAAARHAGFRPCKRCRPETAPNSPAWVGTESTVRRALKLIAEGALCGGSVEKLAGRLGVSDRHLRRLFNEYLGASPVSVAQTQRLHLAKQLLERTSISMTDVALGAGYSSQRRFNEDIKSTYGETPSSLRRKWHPKTLSAAPINLRFGVREPFSWTALLEFFAARAINDVEFIEDQFERTVRINGADGRLIVRSTHDGSLAVQLQLSEPTQLLATVERIRTMLDLDADITNVEAHLSADDRLAPTIARNRGLRVPGAWDPFELSVRAIVGQQVTVAGARKLLGRLCSKHGTMLSRSIAEPAGRCSRLFPTAEQLAEADLSTVGLTGARVKTLAAFAKAVASRQLVVDESVDPDNAVGELMAIPGIGVWTANYIAMRALKDPDAFPSGDSALLAASRKLGIADTHRSLNNAAERWRPWRSYAAMHLWHSLNN